MGFWDKVKGFFGGGSDELPPDLGAHIAATVLRKLAEKKPFTAKEVAEETRGGTSSPRAFLVVVEALDQAFKSGGMPGWTRTMQGDSFVYERAVQAATPTAAAGGVVIPLPTAA